MNLISCVTFIFAVCVTSHSFAESSDSIREDVLRLAGFNALYQGYVSGCEYSSEAASLALAAARAAELDARRQTAAPQINESATPATPCNKPDQKQVLKALASVVGADIDSRELEQMKVFLSSAAGQNFLRLQSEAIVRGNSVYANLHRGLPP